MKYKKPHIKLNEALSIEKNAHRQYLNNFVNLQSGKEISGFITADNYLSGLETVLAVDPKGNGVEKVTWLEPYDIRQIWENREQLLGMLMLICCLIFLSLLLLASI